MEFSTRFKELRLKTGLSQEKTAEKLGYSLTTISMWEQGMRKPDLYGLIKLSDYFNCTIDYLVGR